MNVTRHTIAVTTDDSGDATVYTDVINGMLVNIIYTKDDFADGVDFAITGETTGLSLWEEDSVDASKTVSPRQPLHDQSGNALLYAGQGEAVMGLLYLSQERMKLVIANGGDTKSGTIDILIAGPTG